MKKIDIYIDITNSNNCWGMIHNRDNKNILVSHDEFVRFPNYSQMMIYINSHYNSNEVVYHSVDYNMIEYKYYTDKPELNCIDIKYYEYINGKRKANKIRLPHEFEQIFIEILKINKKLPENYHLDSRYYRSIDVHKQEKIDREEAMRSIKMSLDEFFRMAGDKIKTLKNSRKIVKGITLFVTVAALGTMIGKGYTIVKNNDYYASFITQANGIKNIQDVGIYFNKGDIGKTIEKLVKNDYSGLTTDDIEKTIEFIKTIESGNFDNNDSHNYFNLTDYFDLKVDIDVKNYSGSSKALSNIEKLYSKCITYKNRKPVINSESAHKYIDYVASLTFMYDTYHDTRPSLVSTSPQSITSSYATIDEIRAYDSYPPILRYIILQQLKDVLLRSNYEVKNRPAYYFGGTDKQDLLGEINKRIDACINELYTMCQRENDVRTL